MPIRYEGEGPASRAIFAGACAPEEADALLEWLRRTPAPTVDLSACDGLHTALAQLLLAARVRVAGPPTDPVLAGCLGVAPPQTAAPPAAARPARQRGRRGKPAAVAAASHVAHP